MVSQVNMSNTSYSWIILVVIPFNSVLNPFLFLYGFFIKEKKLKKVESEKNRFYKFYF